MLNNFSCADWLNFSRSLDASSTLEIFWKEIYQHYARFMKRQTCTFNPSQTWSILVSDYNAMWCSSAFKGQISIALFSSFSRESSRFKTIVIFFFTQVIALVCSSEWHICVNWAGETIWRKIALSLWNDNWSWKRWCRMNNLNHKGQQLNKSEK